MTYANQIAATYIDDCVETLQNLPKDWRLTPIKEGKKAFQPGWQTNPKTAQEVIQELRAVRGVTGYGLVTGNGLLAIDFDGPSSAPVLNQISLACCGQTLDESLPETVAWTSGKEGRKQLLFRIPEGELVGFQRKPIQEFGGIRCAPSEQIEFRGARHQSVLPPSYRPDLERCYTWITKPLSDGSNVAEAPEWLIRFLNTLVEPEAPALTPTLYNFTRVDDDEATSLASVVSAPTNNSGGGGKLPTLESLMCNKYQKWVREGIAEGDEGGRNSALFKIACDAYGVADWAVANQINLLGNPEEIILRFNENCKPPQPWRDVEASLKQIDKKERVPVLSPKDLWSRVLVQSGEVIAKGKRQPAESDLAGIIAKRWEDKTLFDPDSESFYFYSEGLWTRQRDSRVQAKIQHVLKDGLVDCFNANIVRGVTHLLRGELQREMGPIPKCLIPMRNGVLDTDTKILMPHTPDFFFTYQLPYSYNVDSDCPKIKRVLLENHGGDEGKVHILRCFFKAIVMGWTELHKYLELVGVPRSGKSLVIKLATALVGIENTKATEFKTLAENKFETANIKHKKLLILADADRYNGDVSVLKKVTGQDSLRFEEKNKQAGEDFMASCLVVVASNHPIRNPDYDALRERKIPFKYPNEVPEEKRSLLLEWSDGQWIGELADEIEGFFNWVLAVPDDEARAAIGRSKGQQALEESRHQDLIDTHPLALWVDHCLVVAPGATLQVGVSEYMPSTPSHLCGKLYPSYQRFQQEQGGLPTVSLRTFGDELEKLLTKVLKLDVKRCKPRNKASFVGIDFWGGEQESRMSPLATIFTKA